MAHYAFLDKNNIVIEVITGIDENELIEGLEPEKWYAQFRNLKCVRTSYNNKIRKNYAGIGYFYDEILDAFIPPKPFHSWIFNEITCRWEAPKPYPSGNGLFLWDDDLGEWISA